MEVNIPWGLVALVVWALSFFKFSIPGADLFGRYLRVLLDIHGFIDQKSTDFTQSLRILRQPFSQRNVQFLFSGTHIRVLSRSTNATMFKSIQKAEDEMRAGNMSSLHQQMPLAHVIKLLLSSQSTWNLFKRRDHISICQNWFERNVQNFQNKSRGFLPYHLFPHVAIGVSPSNILKHPQTNPLSMPNIFAYKGSE